MMKYKFRNIAELWEERAAEQANKIAYRFLANGEQETAQLSFGSAWQGAQYIARLLQDKKITHGERALVLYPAGLDYIPVMGGCMAAGIIPAPVYPAKNLPKLQQLEKIALACQASILFTTDSIAKKIEFFAEKIPQLYAIPRITTDELLTTSNSPPGRLVMNPHEIAFLQFTSGSTGNPKGVMVTQQNLLAYAQSFHRFFNCQANHIGVSWLPQYHDMGLIGIILQTFFEGGTSILMPPTAFLSKPIRWLNAITHYRAIHSGAPNFAYDLCVARISEKEKAHLDLNCWEIAYNGSETIRNDTIKNFNAAFTSCGLKPTTMTPGYGLAEATLIATSQLPSQSAKSSFFDRGLLGEGRAQVVKSEHENAVNLVSCGVMLPNQHIKIVNPETHQACDEGTVGEIWINGPTVAKGYWNDPEKTTSDFSATIAGDDKKIKYLRSGDIGFLLDDNLYFVTRKKNLIVLYGKNYYPEDIELSLENEIPALQKHAVACCEYHLDTRQGILVMAELAFSQEKLDYTAITQKITQLISQHSISTLAIVLLKPGSIPKTTSGKIQRHLSAQRYIKGELTANVVYHWTQADGASPDSDSEHKNPPTPAHHTTSGSKESIATPKAIEQWIIAWLKARSNNSQQKINIHENFIANGLDSVAIGELISDIETQYHCDINYETAFEKDDIEGFIHEISKRANKSDSTKSIPLRPMPFNTEKSLSLSQNRMWFIQNYLTDKSEFNLPLVIAINEELDLEVLIKSIHFLVERHLLLRCYFTGDAGNLKINLHNLLDWPLVIIDLSSEEGAKNKLDHLLLEDANINFNCEKWPLWQARLIKINSNHYVLSLCFHHIISDIQSLVIFYNELSYAYTSLIKHEKPQLTPLTVNSSDYAQWQRLIFNEDYIKHHKAFWSKYLLGYQPVLFTEKQTSTRQQKQLKITWSPKKHIQLNKIATPLGISAANLFLTAFLFSLASAKKQKDVTIGVAYAQREQPALKLLFGYLSEMAPVRMHINDQETLLAHCQQTQVQLAKSLSHHLPSDIIAGAINQASSHHQRLVDVLFNFIDIADSKHANLANWERLPTNFSLLDLSLSFFIITTRDQTELIWSYDENSISEKSIQEIAHATQHFIAEFIKEKSQIISTLTPPEKAAEKKPEKMTIHIAANFTIDPLESALSFWKKQWNLAAIIKLAPYNQLFQELIDPTSAFNTNAAGFNCVFFRPSDVLHYQKEAIPEKEQINLIEKYTQEFMGYLKTYDSHAPAQTIVALPSYPPFSSAEINRCLDKAYQNINELLTTLPHCQKMIDPDRYYPVTEKFDPQGEQIGHVPFSPNYYTALASALFRTIMALLNKPFKVIICDCDNTLWSGVCAEDGATSVKITEHYQQFQKFLLDQKDQGKLICLNSKNNLDDVKAVFEKNTAMILKWEDITGAYVNWQPKSENITQLANDLSLGLDSFIFIDDNPIELAEVQANCPDVLTIAFTESTDVNSLIDHHWAFDQLTTTAEDKKRHAMYQQEIKRSQHKSSFTDFKEFIDSLDLRLDINELIPEKIPRSAQLTQRTNQFNSNKKIYSEHDLQQALEQDHKIITVEANDRFGHYGQIGLMIYHLTPQALIVDKFLLSCRILGRGVEYRLLNYIGKKAADANKPSVAIAVEKTLRNQPIMSFFKKISNPFSENISEEVLLSLTNEELQNISFLNNDTPNNQQKDKPASRQVTAIRPNQDIYTTIYKNLANVTQIEEKIYAPEDEDLSQSATITVDTDAILKKIKAIWVKILKTDNLDENADFFLLGATSLQAIELFFALKKELKVELNFDTFSRYNTITKQHQLACGNSSGKVSAPPLTDELQLPRDIIPNIAFSLSSSTQPKKVLLTGATGFLGCYLLERLIAHFNCDCYCLVRAKTTEDGLQRILENAKKYHITLDKSKIHVVSGDLTKEKFSLDDTTFNTLAGSIDSIIHCAAQVNFTLPYEVLAKTNLLPNFEILRFSSYRKQKAIHYISTIAVFDAPTLSYSSAINEFTPLPPTSLIFGGYAQTKRDAEVLYLMARAQGFPINIYRLSAITADTQTGISHDTDIWTHLVEYVATSKSLPNLPVDFDIIPVDICATMLVNLMSTPKALNQNFHLTYPKRLHLSDGVTALNHEGVHVDRVSYDFWQKQVVQEATSNKGHPLSTLLPLFQLAVKANLSYIEFLLQRPLICTYFTFEHLKEKNIHFPEFETLLPLYLRAIMKKK